MEEIRKIVQNSSLEKCKGTLSGLSALVNTPQYLAIKNIAENSIASSWGNSGIAVLQKEIQQKQEIWNSCLGGCSTAVMSMSSVLDNYNRIAELTNVIRKMAELIQPLPISSIGLQNITSVTGMFSRFGELSALVVEKPSLLTHLYSALERQIDTSLSEYLQNEEEFSEADIDSSIEDEIVAIVSEENKDGLVKQFIAHHGEKGKKVLVKVLKRLMNDFLGGLVVFCCTPIYKAIVPAVLWQEPSIEATQIAEIPIDTEIHVWGDVTNNYVQISYTFEERNYNGYISKDDFEANSQKVSDELKWEYVVFINDVVEQLAESWKTDCESVYRFLKDDTSIMNDYILEHYDVLCFVDKKELVNVIEEYCSKMSITVPKNGEN